MHVTCSCPHTNRTAAPFGPDGPFNDMTSSRPGCRAWMLKQQEHTCVGRSRSWQQSVLPCRSSASQAVTSTARASHSEVGGLTPHVGGIRALKCQRMSKEISLRSRSDLRTGHTALALAIPCKVYHYDVLFGNCFQANLCNCICIVHFQLRRKLVQLSRLNIKDCQ